MGKRDTLDNQWKKKFDELAKENNRLRETLTRIRWSAESTDQESVAWGLGRMADKALDTPTKRTDP